MHSHLLQSVINILLSVIWIAEMLFYRCFFCMKSNSVNGNVAVISDIFRNFTLIIFEELPPNKPMMGPSGVLCKVTKYL